MEYKQKLLEFYGENGLVEYKNPASAGELIRLGSNYVEAWRRIESSGPLQVERVWDVISMILAECLQPIARQKYGNGGEAAMLSLLNDLWQEKGQKEWEKQKLLAKQAIDSLGLDAELGKGMKELVEQLPQTLFRLIAAAADRLKMVPVENTGEISGILAAMYGEASHVN